MNRNCPFRCERPTFQKIHRTIKNMLFKFKFECKFAAMGCQDKIYYDKLSIHEQNCPYEIETCQKCQIQMRIAERNEHDCVTSLKNEVQRLSKTSKSRLLFYTSGGSQEFHIFEEKSLDWSTLKLTGDFQFPILPQIVVLNGGIKDQVSVNTRIIGIGGIKQQQKVREEGKQQIVEKVQEPCKDTFEVFINLLTARPKFNMRQARAMFGVGVDRLHNEIYVVGGIDSEKKEIAECEIYDIKQNMWSQLPSMNQAKSSLSLIVVNTNFLYAFGGYPISNSSIELFFEQKWSKMELKEGEQFVHPFWSGSYLSDKLDGSILIFGGGLKYNDADQCYDFNADSRTFQKIKMTIPKEDRFFYNAQKIQLSEDNFITLGRHGVYKIDFVKRTCYKISTGYRDLDQQQQQIQQL
ncbi:UNKNOWN [Stylonychia lemnae]|uniref:Kelch motif family protein n=1 Tax=Stylonychia lemnae TaxID=5949 RepID=A0A077ZP55_STYLE|nr:UNKNOWN [Stylonychia lemnae]|eukprot:CDW71693.1 UNKNOWN [Stylonychia lemnae]